MTNKTPAFTEDIVYQWQKIYSQKNLGEAVVSCATDPVLLPYFLKYLPREDPILECGCGLGQWVIYLGKQGYKMVGVDIVPECIELCKKYSVQADVRLGDVRNLPFPDQYFGGYISIGVLEHMIEGPESTIKEMKRVLKPSGVAIVLVPAFNGLMKLWYPLRKMLVSLTSGSSLIRQLLGKALYQGDLKEYRLKKQQLENHLRKDFWPILGSDPLKGPIFIEYKYTRNLLERMFTPCLKA